MRFSLPGTWYIDTEIGPGAYSYLSVCNWNIAKHCLHIASYTVNNFCNLNTTQQIAMLCAKFQKGWLTFIDYYVIDKDILGDFSSGWILDVLSILLEAADLLVSTLWQVGHPGGLLLDFYPLTRLEILLNMLLVNAVSMENVDLVSHHIHEINSMSFGRRCWDFYYANFKQNLGIDILSIQVKTTLEWMPEDLTDGKSKLVQVMAWCCQETRHYLNQYWPGSLMIY